MLFYGGVFVLTECIRKARITDFENVENIASVVYVMSASHSVLFDPV